MPVNRTLTITVTFNCVYRQSTDQGYGGTASYALTASTPAAGDIVAADGSIFIDQMPAYDPAVYNEDVDISFVLASPCTVYQNEVGGPVVGTLDCVWAHVHGAAITITGANGGPAPEFSIQTTSNPNVIHVIDEDEDTNTYNYCLAVELPSLDNYFITVDPRIVNGPPH